MLTEDKTLKTLTRNDVTEVPMTRSPFPGHVLTEANSVALSDREIAVFVPVGTLLRTADDGGYWTPGGVRIRYQPLD